VQEDYLHYIWLHKKFKALNLQTTRGEPVEIISSGSHNLDSGPDFFNAQIRIGGQLWAGNVEIHVKAGDWFVHGHEKDSNYDNVILHVVWEQDTEVFRKDKTIIPTLVLKPLLPKGVMKRFDRFFSKDRRWINCEKDFGNVEDLRLWNWLERLYFERLEQKSDDIKALLETSANDWEAVLFKMLAKNFGLKVNGAAFLSLSNSFDFSVVRKQRSKLLSLEALFFGPVGLLNTDFQDAYLMDLRSEYAFLSQKFGLSCTGVPPAQFFRLRPSNFPTLRLSQLAGLYHRRPHLFSEVINTECIQALYSLFSVSASAFWDDHYTFGKSSGRRKKALSRSFINLVIINTILPIKFAFAKFQGRQIAESIQEIIGQIPSERNSIVNKFNTLRPVASTALQSQALLQLKNNYCDKNKCLQCAIGYDLLKGNV
jgi:hypothetical protein